MPENNVTQAEMHAREQLVDERFSRDKERLEKLESSVQALTDASLRLVETQKRDHEDIQEHAKRLAELEHRPGQWADRVVAALISSGVAALVSYIITVVAH
nr:MAG TPA: Hemolysin [Caudoviricetes sp.]